MGKRLGEKVSDFVKALARLDEALKKDITDDIIIDGIIQRFEFTFEQSWKVMKSYLEEQGIIDEEISPRSTIKIAYKHKIIVDGEIWIEMMLDRNRTSHMYDETIGRNIVERIRKSYIAEFNNLKAFLQTY
ncbi:nucleotidyltransferase substrate binding protein [Clostridium sp. CF011]|nr:nucleotidyltransferase substrate binding protein [Clostridium sp. CF011]